MHHFVCQEKPLCNRPGYNILKIIFVIETQDFTANDEFLKLLCHILTFQYKIKSILIGDNFSIEK